MKYLEAYCKEYNVEKSDIGLVPIIFVRDKYILDYENIEDKLESYICNRTMDTKRLDYDKSLNSSKEQLQSISIIQVIIAALLNGINPCSISMLLFLVILLNNDSKSLLKMGMSFCVGKIIASFLIGTLLYRVLKHISGFFIINLVNYIFVVLFIFLAIINLHDFVVVRQGKYGKIKSQLPTRFRKFSHNVIKNTIEKFMKSKWIALVCIVLGMAVASTEFLCAGQIYLSTIITVIHSNSGNIGQGLVYLLVYCIVCVIPLMVIIILMSKGAKEIEISTFFTQHLDKIKFIYAVTFFVIAIYMICRLI